MGTMATVRVNTSQRMVLYREFIIQEAYDTSTGKDVWEWTHEDFCHEATPQYLQATGTCQTVFECIDAVDNWHDNQNEAAYERQQQALLETGGPDDSAYRRDMIAAGRGHLIGGA